MSQKFRYAVAQPTGKAGAPAPTDGPAKIAVVSFAPFLTGIREEQQKVADEIFNAFSTVGWVYLVDHGIPQERVNEIFGLAKRFFDLPLETKMKWKLNNAAVNQGYSPEGSEADGGVDHKESYEHRRFDNALSPTESELTGFRSTMDEFYNQCLTLSRQVLRCLAMVMRLNDDFFDAITKRADPQLRILHYPSIERSILEQEGHARVVPHTDFGLCTLLFQDSVGGLEVDPFHTGHFQAARPVPGAVLINVADLLQRLSNGRVRSTLHRVVSPPAVEGVDVLPARYSIPFFVHPDPETMIEPITMSEGEEKLYETVNAGKWRTMITSANYRIPTPESAMTEGAKDVAVAG